MSDCRVQFRFSYSPPPDGFRSFYAWGAVVFAPSTPKNVLLATFRFFYSQSAVNNFARCRASSCG